jgi:hypothetical protein
MSNLLKIRPVGAELFHADWQMDMNLIVAFRNFANAPKDVKVCESQDTKTRHYLVQKSHLTCFQFKRYAAK